MHLIDYTIVTIYLTGMVIIGFLLQKKASAGIDSYFLGDRSIPWWALGASGMASNLDVSGTMINTAFIFALGLSGFFIEIRGGVTLIMAFLMIFMGKWNRRAQVMTLAEWMHFRFGKGAEGNLARLISAISSILVTIAMITYFAVGSGKFIGTFLGLPDIGIISNQLESAEQQPIDQTLAEILNLQSAVDQNVLTLPQLESERQALDNALKRLTAAWGAVKQAPQDISLLNDFQTQIVTCKTQFQSFQRTFKAAPQKATASAPALLAANLTQLATQLQRLELSFRESCTFRILFDRSFLAATLMIILAMIYTVASGLYGVVWTDVFQGALIFGTIAAICFIAFTKNLPEIFNTSVPMRDGTFLAVTTTREQWTSVIPNWKLNIIPDSTYSIYNLFGIAILFYLIKVTIEGSGGTGGYMVQRYFAAKSDRDAGLLSLFWTFLLSFRWPFIAAMAMLGIYIGVEQGVINDPEMILPVVVNELIPVGLKGFLVAGLMAAAMSTFDSTVNAGVAYWTRDIYQAYLRPKATGKQLVFQSRLMSVVIVILGLAFHMVVKNINEIWGWITMSLGAGMIIPQLIRWYWWRLNGYGFSCGIIAGMLAAVLQKALLPDVPEYIAFSIAAVTSLVATIIGTWLTPATDMQVLKNFYLTTRPFGFWRPVRKSIPAKIMTAVNQENRRDIISLFLAVPWQIVLFLMWMSIMVKRWDEFIWLVIILALLSLGLYFKWFRHLSTEVKVESETHQI
jgi:Na+/proline symporter